MLVRKMKYLLSLLLVTILLTSCSFGVKNSFYNGFMELEVRVPEGWTFIPYNEANITETVDGSKNYDTMYKEYDDNNGYYIGLASIQNAESSESTGKGFAFICAHDTKDFSDIQDYAEYMYYEEDLIGDFDDYIVEFNKKLLQMNDIDYYLMSYDYIELFSDGSKSCLTRDYYVAELNGFFITVSMEYFDSDPVGRDFGRQLLKQIHKI